MKDQNVRTNIVTRNKRSRAARDLRNACQFELLENRTLMSANPMVAPSHLRVTPSSPTSVVLQWKDNSAKATGYTILRSSDNFNYKELATITDGSATTYTDTTAKSGHVYEYEIEATKGAKVSATKPTTTTTPLMAVSSLTAMPMGSSMLLNWFDNAPAATGYNVLRATDGVHYTQIGSVTGSTASTYTDSTVVSGHQYEYEIQAFNSATTAASSNVATAAMPLLPVTGLSATASSPTSINLSWTDHDSSATGYNILRSTDGVHFTQIATVTSATATTYTDSGATSGHLNSYEVQAFNTVATAPASAIGFAITPLIAPTGLTATQSSLTFKLAWTDKDTAAIGYYILRSTDNKTFTPIATITGGTTNTYTDSAPITGTDYYEVEAVGPMSMSAASNDVTATLAMLPVSGLSAAATSPTSIQLAWTDNDPTATAYYVLRATDGVHFTQIASLSSATADSYADTSALSGHAYQYEVQAYKTGATAAVSAAATATTPLVAPASVAATLSGATVNLTWTDKDTSATGYYVLRATDGVHFTKIATLSSATANSYADTTAVSGAVDTYEVEAFNAVATSAASSTAAATKPLGAVSGLTATATAPTSVQLTWKDNDASATGYYILRSTDGTHYTQIGNVTTATTTTYTDTTAVSGHADQYEVQAYDAAMSAAVSASATANTPLAAPTALAAAISGTSVNLTWTDKDASATGYYVLHSTDNVHFTQIATLSSATANSYSDTAPVTGAANYFEVEAFNSTATSVASNVATATEPLKAVSNLVGASASPTSIQLTWTDNDSSATGYNILRSTDGVHFTQYAAVTSASGTTYTDNAAPSGKNTEYEVQAYDSVTTAPATAPVTVLTSLIAPSGLTAAATSSAINLTWKNNDAGATGIFVLHSTDDVHFTTLTTFTNGTTTSYSDTSAVSGTTYYYEIEVYNGLTASAASAVASATISPAPAPGPSNNVTITTRYSDNELVVTAAGTADTVSITESGTTFSITADGTTTTDPATAGGLFVYTRGGTDSINVASSVTSSVIVETIDGAATTITSADPTLTAWMDSTDVFTGVGNTHKVASFAGGVSKAAGASLANPSDAGSTFKANASLFGTGPVAADINQGEVGDCYFMSSLAAFAGQNPQVLTQSAVDMGDGTYVVQFMNGTTPTYVRVNNSFSSGPFNGYMFAQPGADGDLWAPVIEKAFCYFRTGANTYNSINSGWMGEVYADFGVNSTNFFPSSGFTASSFYTLLSTDLASGKEVTLGTYSSPPNLVGDHAYTLISATMVNGVAQYVVRNPWGVAGDSIENAQGYATLTYAQMVANFADGCASA